MNAVFAKDKYDFWWYHFTNEERELREMDVWKLAAVIKESTARNEIEPRIVAEHVLNLRLAKLQSHAAWGSGVLGIAAAALGAGLTVALTVLLSPPNNGRLEVKCECLPPIVGPPGPNSSSAASSLPTSGSSYSNSTTSTNSLASRSTVR